jgi:hypothetical protein
MAVPPTEKYSEFLEESRPERVAGGDVISDDEQVVLIVLRRWC